MMIIQYKFVEYIPTELEERILYISVSNCIAVHRCFCGCGAEVNTPLSSRGWTLRYDGDTISLSPSVGSRTLPCQSHYWIERNQVHFLGWGREKKSAKRKKRDK